MKQITIKDVVREYVKSRDEIEQREADLAEELKEIKKVQAAREQWMLNELKKGEQESVRTDEGTVYRSVKESIKMADWDAFVEEVIYKPLAEKVAAGFVGEAYTEIDADYALQLMKEAGGTEFLNRAANKTACLEVMGERVKGKGRPNPPPNGVSYVAFETVGVRRS